MAHSNVIADMLDNDEEFVDLIPDHQHIWLVLCVTTLGGKTGLFSNGVKTVMRQSGRDSQTVLAAFAKFEELQWILSDGDFHWIRSRFKHRCNSPGWKTAAEREARELLSQIPNSR